MKNKIIRVYADTSVFGGVFDDIFIAPSKLFFEQVKSGRFQLVVSDVIRREIEDAPSSVQRLFDEMLRYAEVALFKADSLRLRKEYITANIVTSKSLDDALHVAIATTSKCDIIVSWNFKQYCTLSKNSFI